MYLISLLIQIAILVLIIASGWIVFTKAKQPGWAVLIPIYNAYVLTQIVGRPWWFILLLLIPIVNIVVAVLLSIDLAKSFGKDVLFGIGLALLGFIFYPILAFSDAAYKGPSANQA